MLVTGGAGFAAGHLFDRLLTPDAGATAARIVAWHRPGGHPPPAVAPGITWRGVDLLDADAVDAAIAADPPDHVYHLAGATHQGKSFGQPTDVLRVNAMGTDHLLRALARHAPRARALVDEHGFVYQPGDTAASEDTPLRPASPYALSKLAQEMVARHAGATTPVEVIVCRPFNHLGPRQSADYFAPNFARQIAAIARGLTEPVLKVGNLTARRDLSDVRDVVRAYVSLMARGTSGRGLQRVLGPRRRRPRRPRRADRDLGRPRRRAGVAGAAPAGRSAAAARHAGQDRRGHRLGTRDSARGDARDLLGEWAARA